MLIGRKCLTRKVTRHDARGCVCVCVSGETGNGPIPFTFYGEVCSPFEYKCTPAQNHGIKQLTGECITATFGRNLIDRFTSKTLAMV